MRRKRHCPHCEKSFLDLRRPELCKKAEDLWLKNTDITTQQMADFLAIPKWLAVEMRFTINQNRKMAGKSPLAIPRARRQTLEAITKPKIHFPSPEERAKRTQRC